MTEEAVKQEFDDYIHEVATHAFHELDPKNVVDIDVPADQIKPALRQDIRQEIIGIKSSFQSQLSLYIDAVTGDRDKIFEKFLEEDVFYRNYHGDTKDELRNDLRNHFDEVVDNIQPLVESHQDDFWSAVEDSYSRQEATEALNTVFDRSSVVEKYRDGFDMEMSLDTGLPIETVEYTDEGFRVLKSGENHVKQIIENEVEEAER